MSLEEKVNDKESRGFSRKALRLGWKVGIAAAATLLSTSLVGSLGVIVGGAFAGGGALGSLIKGKPLFETLDEALTTYSAVNAVIHPMVWLGDVTFPLISNNTLTGWLGRAIYASTLYNAAFVGSYRAASHLIDNYINPKGITKSVTDNFYNFWKRIGIGFFPGYALAANGVTSIAGIPTFALNAFPLGLYNAINPVKVATPKLGYAPTYTPSYAPARA